MNMVDVYVFEVHVKGDQHFPPEWVRQPGEFASYSDASNAARENNRYPFRIKKVAVAVSEEAAK